MMRTSELYRKQMVILGLACCLELASTEPARAAEGRIQILPGATTTTVISTSGSYVLVNSVTTDGTVDCISITGNDITLDLNGQTLSGPGTGTGVGIRISGSRVRVRNGGVRGFNGGGIVVTSASIGAWITGLDMTDNGAVGIDVAGLRTTIADSVVRRSTTANMRITGKQVQVLRNDLQNPIQPGISLTLLDPGRGAFIDRNLLGHGIDASGNWVLYSPSTFSCNIPANGYPWSNLTNNVLVSNATSQAGASLCPAAWYSLGLLSSTGNGQGVNLYTWLQ